MKSKLSILVLIVGLFPLSLSAQLTLEHCYEAARANYPMIRQYALVEQSEAFTLDNAAKGWLPQVSANARASYQSTVTRLPINLSAMGIDYEGLSKDQYDAHVMVVQPLYDGGQIARSKAVAKAQSAVQTERLNVTMYGIRERIQQLFFSVLLLDEQLAQQVLLQNDLQLGYNTVSGMLKSGIANQTDVDAVKVEQLKVAQRMGELRTLRQTYIGMLEAFIGEALSADTKLEKPDATLDLTENRRPELDYYAAQYRWLDSRLKALDVNLRPSVSAFAQGGVGNPGLNMLKKGWDAYYKVGVSLSWNISAWYTHKNNRRLIEADRQLMEAERETFLFNTNLQTRQSSGQVANLRQQVEQDTEIIRLRESIRSRSEKRVNSGIETINEMLRDINAVGEARQQRAIHEVLLLQEIYKIKYLKNQ